MEIINLGVLRGYGLFYRIPYANVKDLSKALGLNMNVIFEVRYGQKI